LKEFRYNNITQPNRNRLLYIDPTVDGLKTGHTEAAGYCLVSSAKRGPRRLLSVVLGAASDSARTQESLKLLNYGFQFYDAVQLYAKNEPVATLKVWKGTENTVKLGFANDLVIAVPKGHGCQDQERTRFATAVDRAGSAGAGAGDAEVSFDDKPYGDYPVLALEAVPVAGIIGRMIDAIRLWFN
jgi:D-alanyl-D-alanine carboxypeptidase (penicillin-binding protein 5/6)